MADKQSEEEQFETLRRRIHADPVSKDQAAARAHARLEEVLRGKSGRLTYQVDHSLPPETIIKVKGSTVTLSPDAWEAIRIHEKRTKKVRDAGRRVRQINKPS